MTQLTLWTEVYSTSSQLMATVRHIVLYVTQIALSFLMRSG